MAATAVRSLKLPCGESIPALGQGTWHMGENRDHRRAEIAALRLGLDLGLSLIDTAEVYGEGAAEELVGDAIHGRRDEVFLVTKVLPSNSTRYSMRVACEASLRRLRLDYIDLYLLHWRGRTPLAETVDAFQSLVEAGKIRYWGVSNFDILDLEELYSVSGGAAVQVDQVLYNLRRRGIEFDLLPWCGAHRLPIMAYSPIEQGRLLQHPAIAQVAEHLGVTPAQVALAWVIQKQGVTAIPKSATKAHVRENRAALDLTLSLDQLALLERPFPAPRDPRPLEML